MQVYCEEQAVYWLQQWGNSFTFGCETPFQTPLQCDAIEHGLQIAFISVSRGAVLPPVGPALVCAVRRAPLRTRAGHVMLRTS